MGGTSSRDMLGGSVKLDRVSTVDQVVDLLRTLILRGDLKPGSRLPEIPLAQHLGVSRNTVREAIPILSAEGLLQREIHRGAVVVTLGPDDVADLYRVRRVIELSAVELVKDADLDRLRQAVEAMEAAAGARDRPTMIEADAEFHSAVAALVGSSRIDRFFSQTEAEMRFAITVLTTDENRHPSDDDLEAVAAEHRVIYEALARGDSPSARHLLFAHLDHNERRLRAILAERTAVSTEVDANTPDGRPAPPP